MAKYVVGIIFIILVAGGAYYFLSGGALAPAPEPVVQEPIVEIPTTQTYASSTFSVTYPVAFSINDAFLYTGVSASKPISGVQFTIPQSMATGTNLSADSYLSVETLPRATACKGDIYVLANVQAEEVVIGSTTYSLAKQVVGAAGNQYEEWVYAIPGSSPCTAVRYFIHSTAIGNYPEGAVREFDKTALIAAFDAIRDSLVLNPSAPDTGITP